MKNFISALASGFLFSAGFTLLGLLGSFTIIGCYTVNHNVIPQKNVEATVLSAEVQRTTYDILNPHIESIGFLHRQLFSNYDMYSVSSYYEYDIVHVSRIGEDEYQLECEGCLYSIGVFNMDDIESLMYWITLYPLPKEVYDSGYFNTYYQDIIEEKLWE